MFGDINFKLPGLYNNKYQTTYANAGANTNITSMTGLTGAIKAPTAITDPSGNPILLFNYTLFNPVNYLRITNNATTASPVLEGVGSDSSVQLALASKGGNISLYDNTMTNAAKLKYYNAAVTHYTSLHVATAAATDLDLTLPSVDATVAGYPLISNAAGVTSFDNPTVSSIQGGPIAGFRNRIINGDMSIDQWNAGTAFTMTSTGQYGAIDRWWNLGVTGNSYTIKQVATGNTDFPFAMRTQRPNGNTHTDTIYYGHIFESQSIQDLAGQTCVLSFYVTAGSNFSGSFLQMKVFTGTGANESIAALNAGTWAGQVQLVNWTSSITTTRTLYSTSFTLAGGITEVAVRFNWTPAGTAGSNDFVDITGVQFEQGSVVTPFERLDPGTALLRCQRFFQTSFPSGTQPKQNAGVAGAVTTKNPIAAGDPSVYVQFRPIMFKNPTFTTYNPSASNANWRNITGSADVTVSVDPGSAQSAQGTLIATSGTVATIGHILGIHWTANAEIT